MPFNIKKQIPKLFKSSVEDLVSKYDEKILNPIKEFTLEKKEHLDKALKHTYNSLTKNINKYQNEYQHKTEELKSILEDSNDKLNKELNVIGKKILTNYFGSNLNEFNNKLEVLNSIEYREENKDKKFDDEAPHNGPALDNDNPYHYSVTDYCENVLYDQKEADVSLTDFDL